MVYGRSQLHLSSIQPNFIAFHARLSAPPSEDPPVTPMYDSLTTNLPHPIMAYPSFPFPPSTLLYPPAATVLEYLRSYATHFDLLKHISLRTKVVSVDWDSSIAKWHVQTSTVGSNDQGATQTSDFDLVVVANGHYRVPYHPIIPGLPAWKAAGKVMHAAWYRHAEYKGDTVLVVGRGPSGIDVADEMHAVSRTVIQSFSGAKHLDLEGGSIKQRCRISEFLDPLAGVVRFEDGTTESGVDFCIFATGYEHSQPYLPKSLLQLSLPPPIPPLPETLFNSKFNIFPLAKHIFPLVASVPPSSLAFLTLPYKVVPFPLAEVQMRAVLAAFEDPSHLDTAGEAVDIVSRYEMLRSQVGNSELAIARLWHKLEDDAQFDYQEELFDFIGGECVGKKVPEWLRKLYGHKITLRAEWKDLVRKGEAEDWVRGVGEARGEAGVAQWVDLMWKLVQRAEKRQSDATVESAKMNRL